MAVVRVMYLLELRVRLLEKMLTDFIDGVDVFLSVHRDANAATLTQLQVDMCCMHSGPSANPWHYCIVTYGYCNTVGNSTGSRELACVHWQMMKG